MRYGVCGGPEMGSAALKAGYDYWEWSVPGLLCPLEDDAAFTRNLEAAKAVDLPCEALNCFIPGNLPIVGPAVDFAALEKYVDTACRRVRETPVKAIVFGSGGARKRPDDWDEAATWDQLVRFASMVAPKAAAAGITVVVEPLNVKETNTLNTVALGAKLVKAVNAPGLQLLADSYHWGQETPTPTDLGALRGLFRHTHTATLPKRLAPGLEPYDFAPFFKQLAAAGYDERMSIEGRIVPEDQPGADPVAILKTSLEILKQAAKS